MKLSNFHTPKNQAEQIKTYTVKMDKTQTFSSVEEECCHWQEQARKYYQELVSNFYNLLEVNKSQDE